MNEEFPYSIELTVYGDPAGLMAALRALEPELGESDRTRVSIEMKKKKLVLMIAAADSTALRAGMNSYLRWLNEALDVFERTLER